MITSILSLMVAPWSLAGTALFLLVFWAWSKTKLKYEGFNIPPFPAPSKPFIGHMLLMKGDLMENLAWMRKKAGDIFSLSLGGRHMIVVNGLENIRQILIKHGDFAADRPVDLSSQIVGEENHGLMSSRGANWKEQRSTVVAILREFGMGKDIMTKKTELEVQFLIEKLASFQGKVVSDLVFILNVALSNIVCSVIVGDRFGYEDEYFKRVIKNVDAFVTKMPPYWIMFAATFLQKVPGDLFGIKDWTGSLEDLNINFCKFQIDKIKKEFDPDAEPENFISAYLLMMHKKTESGNHSHLDETNLIANIKALLLGGTETSSNTIMWCVLFCLHHPEVQEKVYEEIKTQVGTGRAPNTLDMPKLPYLSAVIRETQRLGGVAYILMRLVTENFQVNGHLFPKGSHLLINLNSALQDEAIWENPDEFYPERFLDARGQLIKPSEFLPFGLGRRVCPGEALARVELDLFLSSMFQRFRFEPEDPHAELPPLKDCELFSKLS
ncbi:hypothetical protein EGW08_013641 [Elysia chlorotica]|uniref:Cytochrome P450 n=1 Tax=Elysia chlorotica TaxID=188477 RepID=A0A433TAN3_ELYCH|nr:hypothetical protein EGW08_013641 [Elysia chlorotica]